MKENLSAILHELDSDDELPDVYSDVSILPAYLDNNRFEEIKFAWVNNQSMETLTNATTMRDDINNLPEKQYMSGVLKRQDLYCLKSIEQFTCSSTLIWFINFLMYKDLNSHYNNYLRSCLIKDLISANPLPKKPNDQSEHPNLSERLEVIVKF